MMRKVFIACFASTLPACISLEIDVPDVCVRQHGIELHGSGSGEKDSVSESFTFDAASAFQEVIGFSSSAIAELHGIRIIAPETMEDMGFVSEAYAHIGAEGASRTLAPIELGCSGEQCRALGRELELSPATVTDILEYLEAREMKVDVGLSGRLPARDLTVDVDVCLVAQVSLRREL